MAKRKLVENDQSVTRAERIRKIDTRIGHILSWKNDNYCSLAEMLAISRRDKIWKDLGYGSFEQFVNDRYHLGSSSANRYAMVGEFLLGLEEEEYEEMKKLGYSKVATLAPFISRGLLVDKSPSSYMNTDKLLAKGEKSWVSFAGKTPVKDLESGLRKASRKDDSRTKEQKPVRCFLYLMESDRIEFDDLVERAMKVTGLQTSGSAILCALREVITEWEINKSRE